METQGEKLICHKCQQNSIPAPPGATEKTRYVCKECSPLGEAEGVAFDRCQFDSKMRPLKSGAPEAIFAPDGLRIKTELSTSVESVDLVRRRILNGEAIQLPAGIQKAALERRPWALAVNTKNLLLLPDRLLTVFLLFHWSNFSHAQIASDMNIEEHVSRKYLDRAKKRLCGPKKGTSRVRNLRLIESTEAHGAKSSTEIGPFGYRDEGNETHGENEIPKFQ